MKTVIGNWKMNVGVRGGVALARGVLLALRGKTVFPEVVLCPPDVALGEVRKVVALSRVSLGAQNMHWEEQGAFTGETSAPMLEELGVTHVLIGHSERRAMGETDEMVAKKVQAALAHGLVPVVCVGESREARDAGDGEALVRAQVRAALEGAQPKAKDRVLLAYEPVWAIGTGTPAAPEDAVRMHAAVREEAEGRLGKAEVAVLYGGSVDGENAFAFLREDQVDGVLAGGASVKINQFAQILTAAMDVMEGKIEGHDA